MLLVKYSFKNFINQFNETMREEADNKTKFRTLKQELNEYLKQYNKDITIFNNLKVFIVGNILQFSYTETTYQTMTIKLVWRINVLEYKDLKNYVIDFCVQGLGMNEEELPSVQFVKSDMRENYALYWPDTHTIVISSLTVNQLPEKVVFSILRHEAIHHYLIINNKDASDTSYEFMKLAKEHDAYISQEKNANRSFEAFLAKKEFL